MQITLTIDYAGASADAIEAFARALARLMTPAAPAAPRARAASPAPPPQPARDVFPSQDAQSDRDAAGVNLAGLRVLHGERADGPADDTDSEAGADDDGVARLWAGADGAAGQTEKRKRGRPSKAEMEARKAAEAAASAAPAPASNVVNLGAAVAQAAGETVAAPAAPGVVTELQLREALAAYFQNIGPKPWMQFCSENGGYRTLAGVLAQADGETPADVQARMAKFHKFLTDGLAAHAASKA